MDAQIDVSRFSGMAAFPQQELNKIYSTLEYRHQIAPIHQNYQSASRRMCLDRVDQAETRARPP